MDDIDMIFIVGSADQSPLRSLPFKIRFPLTHAGKAVHACPVGKCTLRGGDVLR